MATERRRSVNKKHAIALAIFSTCSECNLIGIQFQCRVLPHFACIRTHIRPAWMLASVCTSPTDEWFVWSDRVLGILHWISMSIKMSTFMFCCFSLFLLLLILLLLLLFSPFRARFQWSLSPTNWWENVYYFYCIFLRMCVRSRSLLSHTPFSLFLSFQGEVHSFALIYWTKQLIDIAKVCNMWMGVWHFNKHQFPLRTHAIQQFKWNWIVLDSFR